jgi:putative holliday junction resolvase
MSGSRRVLGIDLGERRIGIAVGDVDTRTASPLRTLGRGKHVEDDVAVLIRLAVEQGAGSLVVGMPLDKDGSEGLQAIKTREWAEAVAAGTGLPMHFRDERLTSVRAEQRIGGAGRGRSGGPPSPAQRDAYRARVDREAAALILQDDFDAISGGETQRSSE